MHGPDEIPWLDRLEREVDNLRAALDWAIRRGDPMAEHRFVAPLGRFWLLRGYMREGTQRHEAALARPGEADPTRRARMLEGAGLLALWSGDGDRAIVHLEGYVATARAAGETALAARALGYLGAAAYVRGDAARARALVAEMLAEARAADAGLLIGVAFTHRVLFAIGPHGTARERAQLRDELDEPVSRLRDAGHRRVLSTLLVGRARLLAEVDARAALAPLREGLELARGLGGPLMLGYAPWLAAVLLAEYLPPERVARVAGGLSTLAERAVTSGSRTLDEIYGAPRDRAAWERAAAGRARSLDEIVDELLAAVADAELGLAPVLGVDQTGHPDSLISPREREVLALVVAGRSNKEIAEALFISPFTVKAHVASLLAKLDADNRAQLAVVAMQRGLLAD